MSSRKTVIALFSLLWGLACSQDLSAPRASSVQEPTNAAAPAGGSAALAGTGLARLERKITRTADLDLECDDPGRVQTAARTIAESLGGYVGTSDTARDGHGDDDADGVRMTLRVPSDNFGAAMERLKGLAARVAREHVNAEDVTEEFIDLNARITSEKALEGQFVEILKQAKSVKDALEVHAQLAQVRTDIDKLEGRKQFLENQTSLSTIRLSVTRRPAVVRAGWFDIGVTMKRAASDAAGTAAAILHGAIRIAGFALPIFLLLVLPAAWLASALLRRARRTRSQWAAGK
jgi:hypothetical protein